MCTLPTTQQELCPTLPVVGDRIGELYFVAESTAERLRYRTRDGLLLLMVPLSVAAVAWNGLYWLFIVGLPSWMGRGLRNWGLTVPMFGFVLVAWLGRSFEFDGRAGSVTRRRFYLFGRTWSVGDLEAVVIDVDADGTPDVSDHATVLLAERSGRRFEIVAGEFLDGDGWNRLASLVTQIGGLLKLPVRIEGEPRVLSAETQRRLKAGSTVGPG
jgi:hypothetical protein